MSYRVAKYIKMHVVMAFLIYLYVECVASALRKQSYHKTAALIRRMLSIVRPVASLVSILSLKLTTVEVQIAAILEALRRRRTHKMKYIPTSISINTDNGFHFPVRCSLFNII